MSKSNKIAAFALLVVSLAAIFCPDVGPTSRFLMVEEKTVADQRDHQATTSSRTPPPGMGLSCPSGQEAFTVDWTEVAYSTRKANQTVTFANGMSVTISIKDTGAARASGWAKDANGHITFTVRTTCDASHVITPNASVYPEYPDDYATMELTFDRELHGLYISISNVDSGPDDADAVRIRFYDAASEAVATTFSTTGFVHFHGDYGFTTEENLSVDNHDFDSTLYAKAYEGVKTISLDQSLFCFAPSGDIAERTIYPALDFAFCAPIMASTPEEGPTPAVAIDPEPMGGVVVADPLPIAVPESLSETVPESLSETVPESLSEIVPESSSETVPESLSETGPESLSETVPESLSETGPESLPEILIESLPETFSESLPETFSESLPETFSESLQETFSESLPETFSESLPETFSESLPVTVPELLNVTDSELLNVTVLVETLNDTVPEPLPQTEDETQAVAFTAGVIGESLIMGLSGQMFKFNGRSGAWYSAISSRPFQWNMKIQQYESCPSDSVNFVSAVGLTFRKGSKKRRIEVSVANAYNVNVGCGVDALSHCLGAGSLELLIDGEKHVVGGDYTFKDGTGRIVAFNTFYHCSRKWYDFDVRPPVVSETSLRSGRRLDQSNVFDVIDGLKKTMMDEQACDQWMNERKMYGDLFMQPGRFSTIIVETADISLHIEYKQESERCDAHSIDVWVSSVSPSLLEETWEGVIGETKNPALEANLKFADDVDYEVKSPFDNKCKGCVN